MNVDLSKVVLYSGTNAFKNTGMYPGTLSFPTSAAAGAEAKTTYVINLASPPVFTDFFAYYNDFNDSYMGITNKQWYDGSGVALYVNTSPYAGWVTGDIFPVINGKTLTVTASFWNPYDTTVSINPVSVKFALIDSALAS